MPDLSTTRWAFKGRKEAARKMLTIMEAGKLRL
jgi:hypothetical protein